MYQAMKIENKIIHLWLDVIIGFTRVRRLCRCIGFYRHMFCSKQVVQVVIFSVSGVEFEYKTAYETIRWNNNKMKQTKP